VCVLAPVVPPAGRRAAAPSRTPHHPKCCERLLSGTWRVAERSIACGGPWRGRADAWAAATEPANAVGRDRAGAD
jgi:hypothetical protein